MSRRGFLGMLAGGFVAVTFTAWWFNVLGEVSAVVTIASAAAGVLVFLWRLIPRRATVPTGLAIAVGGVMTISVVGVAVAAPYLDRSPDDSRRLTSGNAQPAHTSSPSVSQSPSPFVSQSSTPSPSPSPTPTQSTNDDLARYCTLSMEFLALAQDFSGDGWTGSIEASDFDPLVENTAAALKVAPREMRAPMTVLNSSYRAARERWTDSVWKNLGVAAGTILSPSARTAADQVDTYDSQHCSG